MEIEYKDIISVSSSLIGMMACCDSTEFCIRMYMTLGGGRNVTFRKGTQCSVIYIGANELHIQDFKDGKECGAPIIYQYDDLIAQWEQANQEVCEPCNTKFVIKDFLLSTLPIIWQEHKLNFK